MKQILVLTMVLFGIAASASEIPFEIGNCKIFKFKDLNSTGDFIGQFFLSDHGLVAMTAEEVQNKSQPRKAIGKNLDILNKIYDSNRLFYLDYARTTNKVLVSSWIQGDDPKNARTYELKGPLCNLFLGAYGQNTGELADFKKQILEQVAYMAVKHGDRDLFLRNVSTEEEDKIFKAFDLMRISNSVATTRTTPRRAAAR